MKLFRLNNKQKIDEETYQAWDKLVFKYLKTFHGNLEFETHKLMGSNEHYWNIMNQPISYKYDFIRFKRS